MPTPTKNKLLDGLAAEDLQALLPHLSEVSLPQKLTLNTPGQPIEQLYFPTSGVVSLIASLDEGIRTACKMFGVVLL